MTLKLTTYPANAANGAERYIMQQVRKVLSAHMNSSLTKISAELRRELNVTNTGTIRVIRPRIRGRRTRLNVYSRHPVRKQPWAIMASVHIHSDKAPR